MTATGWAIALLSRWHRCQLHEWAPAFYAVARSASSSFDVVALGFGISSREIEGKSANGGKIVGCKRVNVVFALSPKFSIGGLSSWRLCEKSLLTAFFVLCGDHESAQGSSTKRTPERACSVSRSTLVMAFAEALTIALSIHDPPSRVRSLVHSRTLPCRS